MVINLIVILLGILFGRLLFASFPMAGSPGLPSQPGDPGDISVIIPARNEEKTLPLLLGDLRAQTRPPLEILCVNDDSTDKTREAALAGGAILLDAEDKPEGFIGKSWACMAGAKAAAGRRLLFLDADVRLAPDALAVLAGLSDEAGCTVSVQPTHQMKRIYERGSFFFSLVQVAANGVCMRRPGAPVGLFGPAILIARPDYDAVGGHETARRSIADDLALGQALSHAGRCYRLLLGGEQISYRMYGDGFAALVRGWTKNIATGASKTRFSRVAAVFFWITACVSAPLYLIVSLVQGSPEALAYAALLVLLWGELWRVARRLENAKVWAVLAYPLPLLLFILVFFWSLAKKVLGLNVKWKGRRIRLEK